MARMGKERREKEGKGQVRSGKKRKEGKSWLEIKHSTIHMPPATLITELPVAEAFRWRTEGNFSVTCREKVRLAAF